MQRGYHLYRRNDGRIEFATSAVGDFEPAKSHLNPWLFPTRESAMSCWRRWSNMHPAWAQDWLPEVREVDT